MRPEVDAGLVHRLRPAKGPARPLDRTSADSRLTLRICDTPRVDAEAPTRFDDQLDHVRAAPVDEGVLELIVRRPADGEREVLDEAHLDQALGLVGDRWAARDIESTPVYLSAQLTLMNTRVLAAIEPDRTRWPLAGDQLYVDLDLREATLPAGTQLAVGSAIIEVSETPHTGCARFSARFGSEALRWINSSIGRAHRLRGLNARIVQPGTVHVGDAIRRR